MPNLINAARREPLVHFAVLGLVLFGIDRAWAPAAENPRHLEIPHERYAHFVQGFEASRGRKPTERELEELVDTWLTNEVLYREGRALQLDRGDAMIRERVIQKMRVMVHSSVVVPKPPDETLRAWFEERRAQYAQPVRFSFLEAEVKGGQEEAERRAATVRAAVAAGQEPEAGNVRIIGFRNRPRSNVSGLFGPIFTDRLAALPPGEWHALESTRGWHLVRLDRLQPGEPAVFHAIRHKVRRDWEQEVLHQRAWKAIEAVRAKYDVVRAPFPELEPPGEPEAPTREAPPHGADVRGNGADARGNGAPRHARARTPGEGA